MNAGNQTRCSWVRKCICYQLCYAPTFESKCLMMMLPWFILVFTHPVFFLGFDKLVHTMLKFILWVWVFDSMLPKFRSVSHSLLRSLSVVSVLAQSSLYHTNSVGYTKSYLHHLQCHTILVEIFNWMTLVSYIKLFCKIITHIKRFVPRVRSPATISNLVRFILIFFAILVDAVNTSPCRPILN